MWFLSASFSWILCNLYSILAFRRSVNQLETISMAQIYQYQLPNKLNAAVNVNVTRLHLHTEFSHTDLPSDASVSTELPHTRSNEPVRLWWLADTSIGAINVTFVEEKKPCVGVVEFDATGLPADQKWPCPKSLAERKSSGDVRAISCVDWETERCWIYCSVL